MNRLGAVTVICLLAGAAACQQPPPAPADSPGPSPFTFALVGDNPYPPEDVPKFERLIGELNADEGLEWVIHLGDIRGSADSPCSNEIFEARFALFQQIQASFILTPGDNDWFDCDAEVTGGFDEIERLDFLRTLFYPTPGQTTGGRAMDVESQSADAKFGEFVENVRWVRDEVVFATLHVVGVFGPPNTPEAGEAFQRSVDAALVWIDETFERARALDSPGVFLATQADPWFVSGLPSVIRLMCEDCVNPRPGLERLYPALIEATTAFGRPVVLAVGDTHVFRVDKPLYAPASGIQLSNFTRVEVFGNPHVHWVHVTVDPEEPEVFSFRQRIVRDNVIPPNER